MLKKTNDDTVWGDAFNGIAYKQAILRICTNALNLQKIYKFKKPKCFNEMYE